MSYATILIPGSGILSAYTNVEELHSALGIYLVTWGLVTFFFLYVGFFGLRSKKHIWFGYSIAALGKNASFIVLFGLLATTFFVLAASEFAGSAGYVR